MGQVTALWVGWSLVRLDPRQPPGLLHRAVSRPVPDHLQRDRLPTSGSPRSRYLLDGKIVDYPFPHFKLTNGTEVHGRGANSPQFIRGKRAHRVYGDEVAFIKDAVCEGVIEPMFTVTGQEPDSALILASTPFGQGYFYDTFQLGKERSDGFTAFQYTSEDNPLRRQALPGTPEGPVRRGFPDLAHRVHGPVRRLGQRRHSLG